MTPHDDIEPETDRAIDELLDAASDEAESGVGERPPFAAVLRRARHLDPSLAAPQPPRRVEATSSLGDSALIAALAPFVEAARAEAEHDVIDQGRRRRPGLPRGRSSRVMRWAVMGGVLAAAAAVVLLFNLLDARNALRAEGRRHDDQVMDQAEHERRILEAETGGETHQLARAPRRRAASARPEKVEPAFVVPEEEAPLEALESEPEPEIIEEPEPTIEPSPEPTKQRRRSSKRSALQTLDDRAQQRLAAGDVAGAEKAYRALVRAGGRTGLAELAYGDLFTLAHSRGDARAQRTLWREYLRKFPKGRFADDARAGLCRQSASSERSGCWQQYLDDFPTGAYHRQAARALSRDEDQTPSDPSP